MNLDELKKNAKRFTGFADVYDSSRPAMPSYPAELVIRYLNRMPECVIDIGCGTGLSMMIWQGRCNALIGVEPSSDMLRAAEKRKPVGSKVIQAYAHATGLPDHCADVVISSQSFHWMEPVATLAEINRILLADGIFATVDCDWPPVFNVQAEKCYAELFELVSRLEQEMPDLKDKSLRWPKDQHLNNIRNSGYFNYCREVIFSNRENANAERIIKLALSQGGLQNILNTRPELVEEKWEWYCDNVRKLLGNGEFSIDFNYRMRLGVK